MNIWSPAKYCEKFSYFPEQLWLALTYYWLYLYLLQKQPPEVFYKKPVLKNFTKLTGKHMCHSLFFKKVAWQFSCEFCEFFKNTVSIEHLWWLLQLLILVGMSCCLSVFLTILLAKFALSDKCWSKILGFPILLFNTTKWTNRLVNILFCSDTEKQSTKGVR